MNCWVVEPGDMVHINGISIGLEENDGWIVVRTRCCLAIPIGGMGIHWMCPDCKKFLYLDKRMNTADIGPKIGLSSVKRGQASWWFEHWLGVDGDDLLIEVNEK